MENLGGLWHLVSSVVTVASAVAALTPGLDDDRRVGALRRLVDLLALNVGLARPDRHHGPG